MNSSAAIGTGDIAATPVQRRASRPAEIGRIAAWLVAVAALAIGLANGWFALRVRTEMEVREGTVWLHVLAQTAGVSLYDHHQVAYVNMNHGPLDPWLKYWLHLAAPSLPPTLVTRFFVGLLPLALVGLFAVVTRRLLATAVCAGCVYLFLLGLGRGQFLIGNSDPTALVFLCALLALGEWLRGRPPLPLGGLTAAAIGMGVLAALVVSATTRFAPVALGACAVYGMHQSFGHGGGFQRALLFALGTIAGLLVVFAFWWAALFGRDIGLMAMHFVGVFRQESGWGLRGRMPFDALPYDLMDGRTLVHLGMCVVAAASIVTPCRDRAQRAGVATWIAVMLAGWLVIAWSYARNHGGGGIYYFAPVYLLGFVYVVASLARRKWRGRVVVVGLVLMAVGLPWVDLTRQAAALRRTAVDSAEFMHAFDQQTAGHYVYSEDVHLFRRSYGGERIDMGDMVATIAATGYFGPDFQSVVARNAQAIEEHPPEYVAVGAESLLTPPLRGLLRNRYECVLRSGPLIYVQGARYSLYRLRHDGHAP